MHHDDEHDHNTKTYVLDETVTLKAMTIAELAELAARENAPREADRAQRTTENDEPSATLDRTIDRR